MQILSLSQEDPLEKVMATPPWYSCLGNPMDRRAWWAIDHGVAKESDNLTTKQQQMMGDSCNFSQIHKPSFVFLTYLKFC